MKRQLGMIEIFKKSPKTLNNIAKTVNLWHPKALNAIAEQLKQIPSEDLVEIFEKSPHTLMQIADAARNRHPNALNAIEEQLKKINSEYWLKSLKNHHIP